MSEGRIRSLPWYLQAELLAIPSLNICLELWRPSTNIKFTHSNFALMFDSVSAVGIRGALFNHQHVTDVWTNCGERHRQVRMLPLLVSSWLSDTDFPNCAHNCPLQYSSRQIRRLPHLNLALGSPRPNPQLHDPACSLCRRGSAGTHPELSISQSQPPGPGAGEGQIKACLAPSFFPALTSNQPHSRDMSCQAPASPQLPLIHPLGAQAHHRAAWNPTTVSSGPHCEGAMRIAGRELKAWL